MQNGADLNDFERILFFGDVHFIDSNGGNKKKRIKRPQPYKTFIID
jgi:hypothetical protein